MEEYKLHIIYKKIPEENIEDRKKQDSFDPIGICKWWEFYQRLYNAVYRIEGEMLKYKYYLYTYNYAIYVIGFTTYLLRINNIL